MQARAQGRCGSASWRPAVIAALTSARWLSDCGRFPRWSPLSGSIAEAFTVGEFMPEIRTLPREKKRQALQFAQKSNQLVSAIEVKDYALAEKLVKELGTIAQDFDNSKPMAAIG